MSEYEMEVPEGWERIEYLCYPRKGSKGYKSTETSANVQVVNMYNTGTYVVNGEDKDGNWFDTRYYNYMGALKHARGWMLKHE